jgi:nucleoside-diphosphate-sugar epimerase
VSVVVITGAAGPLGTRVRRLLEADPDVTRVVALDQAEPPDGGRDRAWQRVDLLAADLEPWFEGADTVLHLASVFGPDLDGDRSVERGLEVDLARRVLDTSAKVGVGRLVLLSSATVYGAWPNNDLPLTEDAHIRPNPGFSFAVQKAEIERLAFEWADEHPTATVAVLRPVTAVAEGATGWLAEALESAGDVRGTDDDPPMQFLHLDDLASAVDAVRRSEVTGPLNVAPDGWLGSTEFTALANGSRPRLRVPDALVCRLATLRWRFGLASAPPGLVPYVRHPWVVANDKLRATGWAPVEGNAEAYVAGHEAGPWATLSPRRRQELALGGATGALAAVIGATVWALRRRRRP